MLSSGFDAVSPLCSPIKSIGAIHEISGVTERGNNQRMNRSNTSNLTLSWGWWCGNVVITWFGTELLKLWLRVQRN